MHRNGTLNEEDNQTHYQSQHDCRKKWEKYQHLKVIHLLAEIAWDASLSYFDQNKNNAWCMVHEVYILVIHCPSGATKNIQVRTDTIYSMYNSGTKNRCRTKYIL